MLGDIDLTLEPFEFRFYLCRPDKTIIAELPEAKNRLITPKFNALHELTFELPYEIEVNKEFVRNDHVDMLRGHYLILVEKKDKSGILLQKDYYIISKPEQNASDYVETKRVQCYLLPYRLRKTILKNYSGTKQLQTALEETLLVKTNWTIGTIDGEISTVYRTFDETQTNMLDWVYKLGETFDAVVVWDTVNETVSFYKYENLGTDKGLSIEYGKYLKGINAPENFDDVVTRLYCYGNEDLSIQRLNPTGADFLEDLSFYMHPFATDNNGNIISHSNYMSDSLCLAQKTYEEKLATKEPIEAIAGAGTTTTNINIANHGLVVGDYIENVDKKGVRRVTAIVDANNFTIDILSTQQVGDTILLYKEGTFGKLLYHKEDLQTTLATYTAEIIDLEIDLQIIEDTLDVANANGNPTGSIVAELNAKQAEIDAKQLQIDGINAEINTVDLAIIDLQNEISIENNFTEAQIRERKNFEIEAFWIDTNYTNDEDLYKDGKTKLATLSQPLVYYEIDVVDFLSCVECQHDWDKLVIGDIVTIKYPNFGIDIQAKILEAPYNIDNHQITLKIANAKYLQDGFLAYKDLVKSSVSTATTVDLSRFKWDKAEQAESEVNNLINSIWDKNKQTISGNLNESVSLSPRGILITDVNDPSRMLIAQHSILACSTDGGQTWNHAITPEGVIKDKIIFKFIKQQQ